MADRYARQEAPRTLPLEERVAEVRAFVAGLPAGRHGAGELYRRYLEGRTGPRVTQTAFGRALGVLEAEGVRGLRRGATLAEGRWWSVGR